MGKRQNFHFFSKNQKACQILEKSSLLALKTDKNSFLYLYLKYSEFVKTLNRGTEMSFCPFLTLIGYFFQEFDKLFDFLKKNENFVFFPQNRSNFQFGLFFEFLH